MKFKNATSDVLDVPVLGVSVAPGEDVVVTASEAAGFIGQADVWEPADDDAAKAAAPAEPKAAAKKATSKENI